MNVTNVEYASSDVTHSTTKTTSSETTWQWSYKENRWANMMTSDGSYWVWIPRFSYKITYGENMQGDKTSKDSNIINQNNPPEMKIIYSSGIIDLGLNNEYRILPGFTFGTQQLTGIWIAKYPASKNGSTNKPIISGGTRWTQTATDAHSYSKEFLTITNGSTHLLKNSEWAIMAYYLMATVPDYLNSTSYSGTYANFTPGTSCNANPSGIYGTGELVAAQYGTISNPTNNTNKYWDYLGTSHGADQNKYGHAIWETSSSGSDSTSWYGSYSIFPSSGSPYLSRGADKGLFGYQRSISTSNSVFRCALTVW